MTLIREVSDLHLEFDPTWRLPRLETDKETILLLSGDICRIDRLDAFEGFFKDISERFKKIYYVFGNHEFYRGSLKNAVDIFKAFFQSRYKNIECTSDGAQFVENDITFIMATLWMILLL